jgi:hypothetical protein
MERRGEIVELSPITAACDIIESLRKLAVKALSCWSPSVQ